MRRSPVKRVRPVSPIRLSNETATSELVVNLKTAKVLELMIPPAILARTDERIE